MSKKKRALLAAEEAEAAANENFSQESFSQERLVTHRVDLRTALPSERIVSDFLTCQSESNISVSPMLDQPRTKITAILPSRIPLDSRK